MADICLTDDFCHWFNSEANFYRMSAIVARLAGNGSYDSGLSFVDGLNRFQTPMIFTESLLNGDFDESHMVDGCITFVTKKSRFGFNQLTCSKETFEVSWGKIQVQTTWGYKYSNKTPFMVNRLPHGTYVKTQNIIEDGLASDIFAISYLLNELITTEGDVYNYDIGMDSYW